MKNKIRVLGEKIINLKNEIKTEEATKTSMILPLFNLLGYDVFNPKEVIPEYTADLGIKKGEKIDYLILKNNEPIFLVECKKVQEDLKNHSNQLLRYYHTSKAKFGILTNGLIYQFFSDFNNPNIMDESPFFVFNFENYTENDLDFLIKFSKELYIESKILEEIEDIQYLSKFKSVVLSELSNPSKEFSELIIKKVYTGRLTKSKNLIYTELLNKALKELFVTSNESPNIPEIVTTDEELEIFKYVIDNFPEYKHRISFKDFKGHFTIMVDGSIRKPVLKALLNQKKKYILFYSKEEEIKCEYVNTDSIDLEKIKSRILEF
jgi:hypothetical protein